MTKVSLRDIAREVGVSIASVSIVLSNKNQNNRVSKETAQHIIEKAKELNYTPNTIGKALRMGRSKTLGLIVADISNVFFGTLASYIQEYAEGKGYTVIVTNTNEEYKKMERMTQLLKSRQVDGLIITPTENSEDLISRLIDEKTPITLVDRSFPDLKTNAVLINNYEVSYSATEKLLEKSCCKVACIAYDQNQHHIQERIRGFKDAALANGNKNPIIKKVRYENLQQDMERCIAELIEKEEDIDGLFFVTNTISVHGIKELSKYFSDFQEELNLLCFDESDLFHISPFKVPFIKQPIKEMAIESVDLVLKQIENINNPIKKSIINAEIIY